MSQTLSLLESPVISALCGMRGHEIYDLVSKPELVRAMKYYQTGRVRRFFWEDEGTTLCAEVKGRHTYTVEFFLCAEGVESLCNCPAFGTYSSTCKHVVATMLTLCHVVDPNRFTPAPFSEDLRAEFIHDLEGASVPVLLNEPPSRMPVTIRRDWQNTYRLDCDSEHQGFLTGRPHWLYPFYCLYGKKRDQALVERVATSGAECRLLIDVDQARLPVEGVCEQRYSWGVILDAEADGVKVQLILRSMEKDAPDEEWFVQCSEHLAFLPDKKQLVMVEKPQLLKAYLNLRSGVRSFKEHGSIQRSGLHIEEGLALSYASCLEEVGDLFAALASTSTVTRRVCGQRASLTTVMPTFSVQIDSHEDTDGHQLRVATEMDGEELEWQEDLDWLESMKVSNEFRAVLTRARVRRKALQDAEDEMYVAESRQACKEIALRASEQECFKKVQCQSAAKKYLQQLSRSVYSRDWLVVPQLKDGSPVWRRVKRDLLTVGKFKALARRSFDLQPEAHRMGHLILDTPTLGKGLAAFSSVCREQDMPLLYNHEPLRTARLDISVEIQSGSDIDWFELHPEVMAEGLQVEQAQWERLIRGELLEQADGGFICIDVNSAEALRRVQALLNRTSKSIQIDGEEPVRVPRLQIFEWLDLERAGVQLDIPKADRGVLDSLRTFKGIRSVPLRKGLLASLRPYQKTGLDWLAFLYRHRFGACLADDMGLGKTIQAIALLAAIQEKSIPGVGRGTLRYPHLIVVPPSLLYNWQHEIAQFCPTLEVVEYAGPKRSLNATGGQVLLTTYELVRRDIQRLAEQPFQVAIFDETQQIKNETSRRCKAIQKLDARFRLCLTGTPLENHIGEYFNIMDLAVPGLLEDARPFRQQRSEEEEAFYVRRTRPFILRRSKSEVLQDLPPKQESDVYLEMTDHQKELYTRTVAEVRENVLEAYADKTAAQAGIVALSALTRLRQICVSPALLDPDSTLVSPKLQHLRRKLLELAEEGHASLVFSQFTRALDLIEPVLEDAGLLYTRLDGKTPTPQRKKRVAAFQKEDGPPIFLVSLKAGGVGLNLTRASYVFHVDPWWNPAVETQASDRAHRIGQKNKVFVNRILMHHTIEEKLMDLKARKSAVFKRVVESQSTKSGASSLSRKDFEFLLS